MLMSHFRCLVSDEFSRLISLRWISTKCLIWSLNAALWHTCLLPGLFSFTLLLPSASAPIRSLSYILWVSESMNLNLLGPPIAKGWCLSPQVSSDEAKSKSMSTENTFADTNVNTEDNKLTQQISDILSDLSGTLASRLSDDHLAVR